MVIFQIKSRISMKLEEWFCDECHLLHTSDRPKQTSVGTDAATLAPSSRALSLRPMKTLCELSWEPPQWGLLSVSKSSVLDHTERLHRNVSDCNATWNVTFSYPCWVCAPSESLDWRGTECSTVLRAIWKKKTYFIQTFIFNYLLILNKYQSER